MAETEDKLYELIKKGEVDFSDPCWETCHESGKFVVQCMYMALSNFNIHYYINNIENKPFFFYSCSSHS